MGSAYGVCRNSQRKGWGLGFGIDSPCWSRLSQAACRRGLLLELSPCVTVKPLACVPELPYEDVFAVWEVIWAARRISSEHFVLFIALALVEAYREIIRDNNMDFTDIIKFFNGMS